jgi:tetratricopeptide (TPR) repeat protein
VPDRLPDAEDSGEPPARKAPASPSKERQRQIRQLQAKAISVYQRLYDETQDAAAANRIATLYLKDEKYAQAMPYLEAIAAGDPEDMNVRVKLGLVHMELKHFDRAIQVFNSILEKNPDADRIHFYLGSLYRTLNRTDEAIASYRKVKPDSTLYSEAALSVGILLKQANRVDEARAHIRVAIEKSPRNPEFYLFQANLEEDAKNLDGAVAILERTVETFPEDEKVRYYLGSLYDRQGKVEQSLKQMERILALNPRNVDALNYLGYTWTTKGVRLNDAERLLRKAMTLRPQNGYITDSWGWHLFTRGKISEAVVELERAAKLKPKESTILEHLGDAYAKSNLRQKALQQYREALRNAEDAEMRRKIKQKLDTLDQDVRLPASSGQATEQPVESP